MMLVLTLLLQSFSKLLIMADFEANREFIAQNLCVQKEIKNNCCQGSCHLKKELEKDERKQDSPTSKKQKELNESQLCQVQTAAIFSLTVVTSASTYADFQQWHPEAPAHSIFHPPLV